MTVAKWKHKQTGVLVDAYQDGDKEVPNFVEPHLRTAPKGFYVVTQLKEGEPGWKLVSVYNPKVFEAEHERLTEAHTKKPKD
jgi:hypothetical protein